MFGFSSATSSSRQGRPKLNGPDIASMTSPGPKYKDVRRWNEPQPVPSPSQPGSTSRVTYTPGPSTSESRAAAGLKWGITPGDDPPPYSPPESFYSEAEQNERARLRAKGINPDLKAEMDDKVYGVGRDGKKKKRGFWSKVAGTSVGGGWIK